MRTEKEIEDYLKNNWFKSRHQAFYIRGFLMTEYPNNKNFVFRYAFNPKGKEGLISAADCIAFIENE
jgi:hypothetical protein